MSKPKHPHAAALDRIGRATIISNFNTSEATYSNWKARGVPRLYLKSLAHLAVIKGVSVPEFGQGGF